MQRSSSENSEVKGLAHIRQLRESTIPTNLSSKREVCFMMKSAFKVMDKCLWYLDSGCSRHMTGDRSLFKVFESKKGGNGSKLKLKERESSLYLDCRTLQTFYM